MVDCFIRIDETNNSTITKETVSAWLYSLLSSSYHDNGLGNYFNGSKVKAHSFIIDKEKPSNGEIICVSIRGILPIEKKIEKSLTVGKSIHFGKVQGTIEFIDVHDYEFKRVYTLATPLIMRRSKQIYTHQATKKTLDEAVVDGIRRKYELIYGEPLLGLVSLKVHVESVIYVHPTIRGTSHKQKAYTGRVEIEATDEVLQFIQEVGLGNRTSYGYGSVK